MTSSDTQAAHPLEAFGVLGTALLRTLSTGRLAPSYLFEGTDGEGLRVAARVFAASILAETPPGPASGRAYDLAMADRHPDLHLLKRDKATVISVAALTAVLARAHAKPFEGARQVFLVEPAEAMEPEGIARYLKTLEEPPSGTVFLLLTTRAERLPDTVLSRCTRLRFPPLSASVIAARLERAGLEPPEAAEAAAVAGGSLTRARRIADADLCTLARSMGDAGHHPRADTSAVVEGVRTALERAAKDLAAAAPEGEVDRGREYIRQLLGDLIYILSTDLRAIAAGQASTYVRGISVPNALALFLTWGERAAAIHRNITPGLLLYEIIRTLRAAHAPTR